MLLFRLLLEEASRKIPKLLEEVPLVVMVLDVRELLEEDER